MTQQPLTRRSVVKAGAALSVVSTGTAIAMKAMAGQDPLVTLYRKYRRLVVERDTIMERGNAADQRFKAEFPEPPRVHLGTYRVEYGERKGETTEIYVYTEDDIRKFTLPFGELRGKGNATEAQRQRCERHLASLRDQKARHDEAYRRHGCQYWDEQGDAVHDRLWGVIRQMAETPATSLEGAAAKLRVVLDLGDDETARHGASIGECIHDHALVEGAHADLERLTKGRALS